MSVASVQSAPGSATGGPEPRTYTVRSGDTLSGVAAAHGVSLQALEAANPQLLHPDLIRPGQVLHMPEHDAPAPHAPHAYTVRPGDTLSGIGERFGVDWRVLAQANGLGDPNRLRAGTQLQIASGSAPSTKPPLRPAAAAIAARVGPARAHGHAVPAEVIAGAQAAQAKWDVPASITIAQWSLESGWGRHMPAGSNNPFGIKAVPGQSYVLAPTREEVNGKMVQVMAKFRIFSSQAEALDAHGRLLAQGSAFAQARAHTNDPDAYADALTHRYATDSHYGEKLRSQMATYDLYRYN